MTLQIPAVELGRAVPGWHGAVFLRGNSVQLTAALVLWQFAASKSVTSSALLPLEAED